MQDRVSAQENGVSDVLVRRRKWLGRGVFLAGVLLGFAFGGQTERLNRVTWNINAQYFYWFLAALSIPLLNSCWFYLFPNRTRATQT